MDSNPIGIFDSGIGGLTVCKAVHDLLPRESLIYYGDTARFPYGTRSRETIIRYSMEITDYLVRRGAKLIVVACNTASATALESLRAAYDIPVVGVIEAGARAACSGNTGGKIGVIGTRATVNSGSYVQEISRIAPEMAVLQQQATLLVPIIEEGLLDHDITRKAVHKYLDDMYAAGVRTVILGCTHFPLLKETIMSEFPHIRLIDTGAEIAGEVEQLLREKGLETERGRCEKGHIELYASDITESIMLVKQLFFQENTGDITKLELSG